MGLQKEYEDAVREAGSNAKKAVESPSASNFKNSLDSFLPFVLLLLGLVIAFNFVLPVSNRMEVWVTYANYVVVAYFAARLVVEYRLSAKGEPFFRNHWLDVAMVVPAFSILEEVKLASALRELKLFDYAPEFVTGAAARSTSIAARITRILRMIKRSIGL